MPTRRRWLQVGLLGGAALSAAGLVGVWVGSRSTGSTSPAGGAGALLSPVPTPWTPDAATLIAAIAPVMLGPACGNAAACSKVVEGVRQAVAALSPAAQRDIGELFMLLNIGPARGALTGIWRSWNEASAEDITGFLERWRHSRLALLQAGYHALHDMIFAAWYAEPDSWADIGYPGPPAI